MADFEDLEILVAKIQRQLAPGAKVSHNAKIMGRHTEVMRQIDVLVEQNVGQYTMSVVIDSKDYKVPVDVKGVEEFHGLVDDVGAQKGVMVCPAGFTPAAKKRALGLQIDLYSPVDTDPHKWTAKVSIPVVCDYRSAAIAFGISCSAPYPFTLQADFLSKLTAYDANGTELGTIFGAAIKRWNKGDYPMEPGEYDDLPIFDSEVVLVDNGHGRRVPVKAWATAHVSKQLYYGDLSIEQKSGFKNKLSGGVITNAFTTGILDHEVVLKEWEKIDAVESLPHSAVHGSGRAVRMARGCRCARRIWFYGTLATARPTASSCDLAASAVDAIADAQPFRRSPQRA